MTLRLRLREVHWAAGASVRAHGVRCRPGAERGLEASTGHPADVLAAGSAALGPSWRWWHLQLGASSGDSIMQVTRPLAMWFEFLLATVTSCFLDITVQRI